jgi:hypothetical protein
MRWIQVGSEFPVFHHLCHCRQSTYNAEVEVKWPAVRQPNVAQETARYFRQVVTRKGCWISLDQTHTR